MNVQHKITFWPKLPLKIVASLSIGLFLITQVLPPTPVSFAQISEGNLLTVSTVQVPHDKIVVPPQLGKIDESFQGTTSKTIFFIQDAHDSLEAQENISRLIDKFTKENEIKTVFEEGYEGPVPSDELFGFMKDPETKQKVSYFLLDKLRIGGAEYAHINRTSDFKLIGVENLKLYSENIKCYQESSKNRKDIEADLGELFSQITTLANQYFPKELKTWLKRRELFSEGKLPLLNYLKELQNLQIHSTEQFAKEYPAIAILIMAQTGHDSKLIKQLNALDSKVVFEEILKLEQAVSDTFLQNERDRNIFAFYQGVSLLRKLNRIELTQAEYEAAKATLQNMNTQKLVDSIVSLTHRSLVLSKEWEQHIKNAVQFYDVAKKRDETIAQHIQTFRKSKENTAILVFGGFHANAIKKILKQQGLSYFVISPKISSIDKRHQDYYKQLMTVGNHPFETPFLVTRANKSPSLFFSAAITGEQAPARAELRAIASSLKALGDISALQLIDRHLTNQDHSLERKKTGVRKNRDARALDDRSEIREKEKVQEDGSKIRLLDLNQQHKDIPEGAVPFREGTFASLIDFLPSLRCQLKCRQCWARNFYTQKEISRYGVKEPSFEEILRTIDLLAETGIEGISFSGGEPTIIPRFDEIIAYVKSKGMKVFVNTNGLQFKKVGDNLFIELYKEDRKSTYLVSLENFIRHVDQFCFSLDTVDPLSFRGEAPLLWPEVIAGIKTISARRNKDTEIVITTTVTRENIHQIKTDLLPYVEGILLDVFNKTKQHYPTVRPPIWKFNIFQPLKSFPEKLKRSLGITYDEFNLLHDEAVQMMRERVGAHLDREGSAFTVDQVLRMNRTLQEEKSYKYLMILPNGVLVTTVDDGATSYGLHERGFEVAGYLGGTNPWVYKKISQAIADGIDEKFSKLGADFAPVVSVIKGSDEGDSEAGALEKKISSFDQDSFDHLVVLQNKDEFPVLLGQEIAKRVDQRLERINRKDNQWEIHFTDPTGKASTLTIGVNQDQRAVVYQSDQVESYSRSLMRDVLEILANRNVRLADQGYYERISLFDLRHNLAAAKKSENPTTEFENELNAARDFLGIKENSKVYWVETDQTTFGIAKIREKDVSKIYVETSFLKRLKQSGDKTSLTRAFIHALYPGSSEEKVYQEFEYARSVYQPEQLNELTGGDFVGLNQAISNMIREPRNSFQRAQADLIAKRLKLQIWNMAVLRLNGETRHVRLRVNNGSPVLTDSDEDSGNAKMLYYSVAANPLHFGHIESLFRAMVQSKADMGVIRVQGADDGKSLNGRTIEERHDIVAEFVAHMKRYVKDIFEYSDIGRETSADGESDFIDLIKLNAGRKNGRLYAFNLGGSDHRHFFVPDYEGWEKTHEYKARIKDGKTIPDTLLKYSDLVRRHEAFFKANNVSFGVLFSERDPRGSEFLPEEVALAESLKKEDLFQEVLLRGMNYEGASATAIREALAGVRNGDTLIILPTLVENAIMGKLPESRKIIRNNPHFDSDRYRGFMIELPVLIKQLSMKSSDKDFFIFEHWLEITRQNRGREITSREIVTMFNGKEIPLSLEEVENALKIIKTKTAADNSSGANAATYAPDIAEKESAVKPRSELRIAAVQEISSDRTDRMVQNIRQSTQPATVFVDAEDFQSLSPEQKQEYLIVTLSNKVLRVVVYNENGQQDRILNALLKLNNVTRTENRDFSSVQVSFDRPNVPSVHLSKQILPSRELIERLRKRVSFFKMRGQSGGTLAAALLWAWAGGEDARLREISKDQDGFWIVAEALVNALQRSYENTLALAIAA